MATPSSKFKSKNNFQSAGGFVPGLYGPAEGLPIYSFWLGNTLDKRTIVSEIGKRDEKFAEIVSGFNLPFVSGYLGHVLIIEKLKKLFPRSIFIHLSRDYVDNALSLLKYYENRPDDHWFSVYPFEEDLVKYEPNPKIKVAKQILRIHERINDSSDERFIKVDYAEFCQNPNSLINSIAEKVHEFYNFEINTSLKNDITFSPKIYPKQSKQAEELKSIFTSLIKRSG